MAKTKIIISIVILLAIALGLYLSYTNDDVVASTIQGSDYSYLFIEDGDTAVQTPKSSQGSLGQITITSAKAGSIEIYDATTTVASERASSLASSTIEIAKFDNSAVEGTYTFDVSLKYGLSVVVDGTVPDFTVSYR